MENKKEFKYGDITVVQRIDDMWGVVDSKGDEIVPFGKYGWIDSFDQGLCRVRSNGMLLYSKNTIAIIDDDGQFCTDTQTINNYIREDFKKHPEKYAKWGIININGEEVLPVEYDEIWNFAGKNRYSTKTIKHGIEKEVFFFDLNSDLPAYVVSYDPDYYEPYDDYDEHYEEYAGSYAQMFPGGKDEENIQTSQLRDFLGQKHNTESVNQALCYVLSSIILSDKKDLNEIMKMLSKKFDCTFSSCDMQTIILYAVQNNQLAAMLVDKDYIPQDPSDILIDFAEAWSTLNADLIIKHLDDSFVYNSQWVFSNLDCKGYMDYIRGKFQTLRRNQTKLFVSIVPDSHSASGMMLRICQNGNIVFYRIDIVNGKVTKGDMCMF